MLPIHSVRPKHSQHSVSAASKRTILCVVVLLSASGLLIACDANIQFVDEKRSVERVGATSFCDAKRRVSKGTQGEHDLRVFLIDDKNEPPGTIRPAVVANPPFSTNATNFRIAGGKWAPRLLDANDGSAIKSASVQMRVLTGDGNFSIHPNPRHETLSETSENRRIPSAIQLLVDMSEAAAQRDNSLTRLSAASLWALEQFNGDTTIGELDILSLFFMRRGVVNAADVFARRWSDESQYISADGRTRGFLYTATETKEKLLDALNQVGRSQVGGELPLYEAIAATAPGLRLSTNDPTSDKAIFSPGLIAVTVGVDRHLGTSEAKGQLTKALKALDGSNREKDGIPMLAITYPKSSDITIDRWNEHLDHLCQMTQGGTVQRGGHLFRLPPTPTRSGQQDAIRAMLDLAYHAIPGYTRLRVAYDIKGATPGKRYLIAFKLQATLLNVTSDAEQSPQITIEVEVP